MQKGLSQFISNADRRNHSDGNRFLLERLAGAVEWRKGIARAAAGNLSLARMLRHACEQGRP